MRRLAGSALGVVCALFACSDDTGSEGTTGAGASGGSLNTTDPGWWEDVAPIVYQRCVACHVEGGIAPFSLVDYAEAREFGLAMAGAVTSRTMPPWGVDNSGNCNTYQDARWLGDDEIAVINAWVEDGMPEGDPANAPQLPAPIEGLAEVTRTLDIGADYQPDQSLTDDYRCFVVDPQITEDMFLTAYHVKPGDERMVHHVILYSLESDADQADAEQLDADDAGPGYTCFGGAGVSNGFIGGWAPGTPPTMYPEGTGPRLAAGRKAVLQVHYNLLNGGGTDRTVMDVTLSASAREALIVPIPADNLVLPPGMDHVEASGTYDNPAPVPITVHGVFPHMHTLGQTLKVVAHRGGEEVCIVDVPSWDFHWQQFYLYEEPIKAMPGDQIEITCSYNTEGRTQTTTWGEGTQDEMCINFVYVTVP